MTKIEQLYCFGTDSNRIRWILNQNGLEMGWSSWQRICEHNLHLRIPSPHPGRPDFSKKRAVGRRWPAFGGGRQPVFLKNPACRDVGMELGDVGCVLTSFAINSKQFPSHSD